MLGLEIPTLLTPRLIKILKPAHAVPTFARSRQGSQTGLWDGPRLGAPSPLLFSGAPCDARDGQSFQVASASLSFHILVAPFCYLTSELFLDAVRRSSPASPVTQETTNLPRSPLPP